MRTPSRRQANCCTVFGVAILLSTEPERDNQDRRCLAQGVNTGLLVPLQAATSCVLPTNFHYPDGNPTAGRTLRKSGKQDIFSYFACRLETIAQQKRSPLLLSHVAIRTGAVTAALPWMGNQAYDTSASLTLATSEKYDRFCCFSAGSTPSQRSHHPQAASCQQISTAPARKPGMRHVTATQPRAAL